MDLQSDDLSPRVTRVTLNGRLDTLGVDQVEARFNAAAVSRGLDVLVDLSGVSFVSSMGIRMLVGAARALRLREARMVLCAAQPLVQETLQSMAIDSLIPLTQTEAEARELLKV